MNAPEAVPEDAPAADPRAMLGLNDDRLDVVASGRRTHVENTRRGANDLTCRRSDS
jgi:hypothetical protein